MCLELHISLKNVFQGWGETDQLFAISPEYFQVGGKDGNMVWGFKFPFLSQEKT